MSVFAIFAMISGVFWISTVCQIIENQSVVGSPSHINSICFHHCEKSHNKVFLPDKPTQLKGVLNSFAQNIRGWNLNNSVFPVHFRYIVVSDGGIRADKEIPEQNNLHGDQIPNNRSELFPEYHVV